MKRVGIIGCGNIYSVHAEALELIEQTKLVAVCDVKAARLEKAKADGIATYTDYKEMLLHAKLDAVHICTPHYLHAEMAIFALEHGVDVLCEKPMAIKLDDARRMQRAAEQSGRRLWIVFQNRFNPGARLARDTLKSGKLGNVLGVKGEVPWVRDMQYYSDDWHGRLATEGGGVIINQAIHTLDLMRWLSPTPARTVEAHTANRTLPEIEVEDTAEGLICFDGGIRGNFYFTTAYVTNRPIRLEVCCENGIILLEDGKGTITFKNGETVTAEESSSYAVQCGGKAYWGNSHLRQIKAFYDDAPNDYDNLTEALRTQELMCAIYASAEANRKIEL